MKPSLPPSAPCPCGGKRYDDCCGRFHGGSSVAQTARELMQSRYSAYVLGLDDYLLQTWHSTTRPDASSFKTDGEQTRWLGLNVKMHQQTDANHALVEFVARYKPAGSGRAERLHETSRFVKEDGLWFYVDGEFKD